MLYEARRELIAELRGHPNAQAGAAWSGDAAVLQSLPHTPRTSKQLAHTLADPHSLLQCPFGADFEDWEDGGGENARWLALVELKGAGFQYAANSNRELPYVYRQLVETVTAHREQSTPSGDDVVRTAEDLAAALTQWTQDAQEVNWLLRFSFPPSKRYEAFLHSSGAEPGISKAAAEAIAEKFILFAQHHDLTSTIQQMHKQRVAALTIFHAHLLALPKRCLQISDRVPFILPRGRYVPQDKVQSPNPPYFIAPAAEETGSPAQARIEAPRICQLCGKGFLHFEALVKHCGDEHYSYAEYRKRLFFEAEQIPALPLTHQRKRTMLANFSFHQTHSIPAQGQFGEKATQR